jgi:hypothetical protein
MATDEAVIVPAAAWALPSEIAEFGHGATKQEYSIVEYWLIQNGVTVGACPALSH